MYGSKLFNSQCRKRKTESAPRKKIGKNPNVDTSFLPDKERDEELQRQKEKARVEWLDEQERIKGISFLFT